MSLMQTLIRDSQMKSARELARQQRREAKKESRFGFAKSLLKTGLQFVPGVGKVLSAGVDIIGDPIARSLGAGADADDINLSGGNLAFGGEQSAKDARIGLKDYLDSAKQGSMLSGVTSLVSYGLDKGLDNKFGDMIGLGGKNPELQQKALMQQDIETGVGMGTQTIMDSLEEGVGSEWSGTGLKQMMGYEQGGMVKGKDSLLSRLREQYFTDPKTGITDLGKSLETPWEAHLRVGGGKSKYFDNEESFMESLNRLQGNKFEQGGMVQKYEDGGEVAYKRIWKSPVTQGYGPDKETIEPAGWSYQKYVYDGLDWSVSGGKLDSLPSGAKTLTQSQMDSYRSEQRTQDVSSTYMSDPTEHGIQEILKSPQLYSQVEAARAGNEGALANILEMVRQARPDLKGSNEALTASIKKILPNIDLYGQGYQDVLAKGQSALEGLTGQAQQLRGQEATQMATSGIRRPGAQSSISEGLYSGAEDVYSGMQRGIQGEFDKSFGEFDDMVNLVS